MTTDQPTYEAEKFEGYLPAVIEPESFHATIERLRAALFRRKRGDRMDAR